MKSNIVINQFRFAPVFYFCNKTKDSSIIFIFLLECLVEVNAVYGWRLSKMFSKQDSNASSPLPSRPKFAKMQWAKATGELVQNSNKLIHIRSLIMIFILSISGIIGRGRVFQPWTVCDLSVGERFKYWLVNIVLTVDLVRVDFSILSAFLELIILLLRWFRWIPSLS